MFPHVSSLDRKEANRITPVVCRNTVFLTLLGAVVMFVVGRQLILFVFGSDMAAHALKPYGSCCPVSSRYPPPRSSPVT